jgi:hypothetical protein
VPSASSVDDDKINGAELASLRAIIELHPEQTDVVPKTFEGCPVHTELEIEGLKRIRLVTGRELETGMQRRKSEPAANLMMR